MTQRAWVGVLGTFLLISSWGISSEWDATRVLIHTCLSPAWGWMHFMFWYHNPLLPCWSPRTMKSWLEEIPVLSEFFWGRSDVREWSTQWLQFSLCHHLLTYPYAASIKSLILHSNHVTDSPSSTTTSSKCLIRALKDSCACHGIIHRKPRGSPELLTLTRPMNTGER